MKTSSKTKAREYHLKKKYGITLSQYNVLLKGQGNRCAICDKHKRDEKRAFAVDHNHVTGELRGILCNYCNHRRVGRARDPEMFRRIADYLERHTGLFVPVRKKRR